MRQIARLMARERPQSRATKIDNKNRLCRRYRRSRYLLLRLPPKHRGGNISVMTSPIENGSMNVIVALNGGLSYISYSGVK
jgi:hypothetical protein